MEGASTRVTRQALREYYGDGKLPARRLGLLPEYQCVYVKNAKVASSTILLWMHRIHFDDPDYLPAVNVHRESHLPHPRQVGWRRVVRMLNGRAFRFSFVRDPVRRVESAYRDKVANVAGKNAFRIRLRDQLGLPPGPTDPITFDQFVAAIESQAPIEQDPHWRPQHLNLMHPLVEYDFIGRLENFAADLERLREAAGLPAMRVEVRNVSTKGSSGSLYDGRPDLLRRVRDAYAKDLELYGY